MKYSEIVYEAEELDVRDYRLLIVQIKVIEEDFFESQLQLEIVTPTSQESSMAFALLSTGLARGTMSRQIMGMTT